MEQPPRSEFALFLERLAAITLVVILVWFAFRVSEALLLAFGSLLLSMVIRSISVPLSVATRLPDRAAAGLVALMLIAILAVAFRFVGGTVAEQVQALWHQLPAAGERARAWLENRNLGEWGAGLMEEVERSGALGRATSLATTTFGAVTSFFLIMVTGIYLALDPDLYQRGFARLFPPHVRPRVNRLLGRVGQQLRNWLLGHLLAMVSIGVLTWAGLSLFGIPYALALGLLAGLLEIVPVVGPLIAAAPAVLMAFAANPDLALWVALFYLGVQQVESYLVIPLIQKWAVEMPPALGLMAVVAFGLVFGFLGVLFATPLVVVAIAVLANIYDEGDGGG